MAFGVSNLMRLGLLYMFFFITSYRVFLANQFEQLQPHFEVQSVLITTKALSSNPAHGKVYSIQHYVIKFVSDLRQVGGFLWFPPPIVT
jgi:hypothetical protein